MSPNITYPPPLLPINTSALPPDSGVIGSDWYLSGAYSYADPYVTPYPSSTIESQPWPNFTQAPIPDYSPWSNQQLYGHPPVPQHCILPSHFRDPSRPKSSPSTFGPSPESAWPVSTPGLGIQYSKPTASAAVTSVLPGYSQNDFQDPIKDVKDQFSITTTSPPEIKHPQPRRSYTNIAPTPVKRAREDDDARAESAKKQRHRTSSVVSADMSDDDRYLLRLKENENLPWKDIAHRFQSDKGKNFQVAALQMRYKRLREKYRVWEEADLKALTLAHEYWEKQKWEIISNKMVEHGVSDRWPAKLCSRKWQELEASTVPKPAVASLAPSATALSSPIDQPMHFAFMPLQ